MRIKTSEAVSIIRLRYIKAIDRTVARMLTTRCFLTGLVTGTYAASVLKFSNGHTTSGYRPLRCDARRRQGGRAGGKESDAIMRPLGNPACAKGQKVSGCADPSPVQAATNLDHLVFVNDNSAGPYYRNRLKMKTSQSVSIPVVSPRKMVRPRQPGLREAPARSPRFVFRCIGRSAELRESMRGWCRTA